MTRVLAITAFALLSRTGACKPAEVASDCHLVSAPAPLPCATVVP